MFSMNIEVRLLIRMDLRYEECIHYSLTLCVCTRMECVPMEYLEFAQCFIALQHTFPFLI